MGEVINLLGWISLLVVFFYLVQWYDNRDKPSDFDLVRNHLRRITHPNLVVQGYGRYFIEYHFNDRHVVEYFRYSQAYNEELKNKRQNPAFKIMNHGLEADKAWEKWGV